MTNEWGRQGEPGAPLSRTEYVYDLEGRTKEVREYLTESTYRVTTQAYYPNGLLKETHNPRDGGTGDAFETRTYTAAGRLDVVSDAW